MTYLFRNKAQTHRFWEEMHSRAIRCKIDSDITASVTHYDYYDNDYRQAVEIVVDSIYNEIVNDL